MSDKEHDPKPPNACASPPCLMHEVDPAYMGLTPDAPLPTAPSELPVDAPENDRAPAARTTKASRPTTGDRPGDADPLS